MADSRSNQSQASEGRMSSVMLDSLAKWLRGEVDDMLPAVVVRYDEGSARATIRPIVMMGTTEGSKVQRAQIEDVPVYRMGGGGLMIAVPLNPGDLGWLKASDRDLSLFKQHGIEDWPNTKRLHSFEDAMFFPDKMRDAVIGEAGSLCIQTNDGQAGIFIKPDGSRIALRIPGHEVSLSAVGLFHNGKNIGATHTHIGSPTAPNGPVTPTGAPV